MKNEKMRVAVIGCGRIAGHHCRSILATEGIELTAVCDLVEEKAVAYSKEFSIPCFVNYHEMFQALPGINIVAIATPSGMHYEHATGIMRLYHKSVIVEKPTFMRPSQVMEAYALATQMGLNVYPKV